MTNEIFIILLAAAGGIVIRWGSARLPRADRQILASVPLRQRSESLWTGMNITYYGLILATAQCAAVTLFCILMGSLGYPLRAITLPAVAMIAICAPSARLIARLVEKKGNTFTVGGATFTGFIAAPLIVSGINAAGLASLPVMATLAALAGSYAIGEGMGRLGCISFGCCYGKPLDRCSPRLARLFSPFTTTFSGRLKKAAYEGGLDGAPLIPVQTLTSVICFAAGLISAYLFLTGRIGLSFLVAVVVTQAWRFVSEFLRLDHRGTGKVSVYQPMSLIMAVCSFLVVFTLGKEPAAVPVPALSKGFSAISGTFYLIFIETLWVMLFLFQGRSTVTASDLFFYVRRDRI